MFKILAFLRCVIIIISNNISTYVSNYTPDDHLVFYCQLNILPNEFPLLLREQMQEQLKDQRIPKRNFSLCWKVKKEPAFSRHIKCVCCDGSDFTLVLKTVFLLKARFLGITKVQIAYRRRKYTQDFAENRNKLWALSDF